MLPRSGRWRLHVALVIGLAICAVGFAVELHRGLEGHLPAWVYVLEWPLLGAAGAFLWWRLMHDDDEAAQPPASPQAEVVDDPGLEAWREYVGRLESGDTDNYGRPPTSDGGSG